MCVYIMSAFHILVILLGLSISSWRTDAQIEGFRVVLRWPPALCAFDPSKCTNLVRQFTLHGMWPYDGNGNSVTDCSGSPFDASKLSNIESGLDRAWPSFGGGGNRGFWKYEWEKHGRCAEAEGLLSFEQYFRNAMATWSYLKLEATLSNKGINHNNGYYRVRDILDAFLFGATPTLHYSKVNCKTVGGEVLLYEVYICLNKKGAVTDCPDYEQGYCGGTNAYIKYLA